MLPLRWIRRRAELADLAERLGRLERRMKAAGPAELATLEIGRDAVRGKMRELARELERMSPCPKATTPAP